MSRQMVCCAVCCLLLGAGTFVPADAYGRWLVNPGVKLGYTWGSGGGFTFGLEASALRFHYHDEFMYGPVVNLDYRWGHDLRLRVGAEGCRMGVGVEGGMVASIESGKLRFGLAATPWIGVLLIPYYTYTFLFDGSSSHEFGGYAKVPFMYNGSWYSPAETIFPSQD